jgi:hypothetical protein
MFVQTDSTTSSASSAARPTRAALRTRPPVQRMLIRSWEYIQPVRVGILALRLLVVLWLVFLGVRLAAVGYTAGLTLLPAALAVLAISLWVFNTAAKGWPAVAA